MMIQFVTRFPLYERNYLGSGSWQLYLHSSISRDPFFSAENRIVDYLRTIQPTWDLFFHDMRYLI
jgi:hypothetical protein